jgi:hypothetical protein
MRYIFFVLVGIICLGTSALVQAAEAGSEDIAAKTASGEEIVLHPNGTWEYLNKQKAAEMKIKVDKMPGDDGCPRGTRPNVFGLGRCIAYDDPVLQRGSLSGKGR